MAAQPTTAPVLSGPVPPLAVGFNSRQETGFRLADGFRPGETILLVPPPGGDPDGSLAAAGIAADVVGGTGKTQLAVGFAHQMWSTRSVDLLVWVAAGNRTAIVAGYARAAADLNLAEARQRRRDRRGRRRRDGRRRRAAVPRLAAPHPAPLGGSARRGDVAGRPRRALAAGTGRPGRGHQPAAPRRSWPTPAPAGPPTASPGSAGARRSATSTPGWSASPTSGSRRSTWPRTSRGCRSRSRWRPA